MNETYSHLPKEMQHTINILGKDGMIGIIPIDEWIKIRLSLKQDNLTFIPKGEMCISCKYFDNNCSSFNFKEMQTIERDKINNLNIVKCSCFDRAMSK